MSFKDNMIHSVSQERIVQWELQSLRMPYESEARKLRIIGVWTSTVHDIACLDAL